MSIRRKWFFWVFAAALIPAQGPGASLDPAIWDLPTDCQSALDVALSSPRKISLNPIFIQNLGLMTNQVYELWTRELDTATKNRLGPPEHPEAIERQLRNTMDIYKDNSFPIRQRVNFGLPIWDIPPHGNPILIGYRIISIYRNANPSEYERNQIGITRPFSHLQGRTFFLRPNYQNQRIGPLIEQWTLALSRVLKLDMVVDVMSSSAAIQSVLNRTGLTPEKTWQTPSGTRMLRYRALIQNP